MLKLQTNMSQTLQCQITTDPYNGIHIRISQPFQQIKFNQTLKTHEASTIKNKPVTSVWIYFNTEQIDVLPSLIQKGYVFHHAFGKEIVLYKWMLNIKNLVVPYSMFIIAAGALVIKEGKILLLEEKNGNRKGMFGVPGGRADRGETISDCCERQLFEETGIKGKFAIVVYLIERTQDIYQSVDLYFGCLVQINDDSLQGFKLCQREIISHRWIPLQEYLPFTEQNSMGTQILLAKRVTQLYRNGKLFDLGTNYSENLTEINTQGEKKRVKVSEHYF